MSHETIYCAIYATPRGELRRELIGSLRKAQKERRTRGAGNDHRGMLQHMRSIHERPEEVFDRLVPGHWKGDLIKGAGNRSAVATLVEAQDAARGVGQDGRLRCGRSAGSVDQEISSCAAGASQKLDL